MANPARRLHRLVATRNAARHLKEPRLEADIMAPEDIARLLPVGAVHQGLAVLTDPLEEPDAETFLQSRQPEQPLLVLDRVTDPQNVGAVLRSAAVFGARAVVTTWRHSPPVTGALAKAATGAVEHVAYLRVQNLARTLAEIKAAGYMVVGLAEDGPVLLQEVKADLPLALVLGSEGTGLRHLTRQSCDLIAHIPTPGPIKALNVSNAAALALYHAVTGGKSGTVS